eukprot:13742190-Ditylum_brightwellii.AAC.1
MSPVLNLLLSPDTSKSDIKDIPQIQIDQWKTIVNSIYEIHNEPKIDSEEDLTNDDIFLAIMGQAAIKGIGQNHMQ